MAGAQHAGQGNVAKRILGIWESENYLGLGFHTLNRFTFLRQDHSRKNAEQCRKEESPECLTSQCHRHS